MSEHNCLNNEITPTEQCLEAECVKPPNIYKMALHSANVVEDGFLFTVVLRVPGGWIYRSYDKGNQVMGAVFVPFNNEFLI